MREVEDEQPMGPEERWCAEHSEYVDPRALLGSRYPVTVEHGEVPVPALVQNFSEDR